LTTWLHLNTIERHVVVADARNRLKVILSLQIEQLYPSVDIHQPKTIDIIYDQIISELGIRWTLNDPTNVRDDI
jgi:hypothetical protein